MGLWTAQVISRHPATHTKKATLLDCETVSWKWSEGHQEQETERERERETDRRKKTPTLISISILCTLCSLAGGQGRGELDTAAIPETSRQEEAVPSAAKATVFFHCQYPRSGSCCLPPILATQRQRPHPPAGGCSALEEQHVTHRRSWKHQLPAVPASPATGVSAEEPQTHPSRAWSSDSGRKAASSVQRRGHLQLRAAMWAVWVWCPDRQPPQSLARQHGARGLQARPSPLPQTLEGRRGYTVTYFLGRSRRWSVIEPPDGAGSFHSPRSSPTFPSKKCEGMLNTPLPPDSPPRGRTGAGTAAAHTAHLPQLAPFARFPPFPAGHS